MALSIKKAGRVCVSSSCSSCVREGPFFSVKSTETSAGDENFGKDLTFNAVVAQGNPHQGSEFTISEETSSGTSGLVLIPGCSDMIMDESGATKT